jgi:hypothetical protein
MDARVLAMKDLARTTHRLARGELPVLVFRIWVLRDDAKEVIPESLGLHRPPDSRAFLKKCDEYGH